MVKVWHWNLRNNSIKQSISSDMRMFINNHVYLGAAVCESTHPHLCIYIPAKVSKLNLRFLLHFEFDLFVWLAVNQLKIGTHFIFYNLYFILFISVFNYLLRTKLLIWISCVQLDYNTSHSSVSVMNCCFSEESGIRVPFTLKILARMSVIFMPHNT